MTKPTTQVRASNQINITAADVPAHASTHVTGGSDVIAGAVAGGAAGLMTGTDKSKLDGIAAGAEVNVNADWNAVSGDAQILNKPTTMPPAAHTHAVADLTDIATTYLKLDASNDPITGSLLIRPAVDALSGFEVQDKDANVIFSVDTINNRIGLLTASPEQALHVKTDINTSLILRVENVSTGSAGVAQIDVKVDSGARGIILAGGSGVNTTTAAAYAGRAALATDVTYGTGISIVARQAAGDIRWYTGGIASSNERLRMLSDGKVGIGTTAPRTILDLVGDFHGQSSLADSTNKFFRVALGNYDTDATSACMFFGGSISTENYMSIGGGTNLFAAMSRLVFYTTDTLNATTGTERMRITSAGKIGVGITAPAALFHVKGIADEIQNIIQGYSSQTANLTEWRNSSAGVLASVSATGGVDTPKGGITDEGGHYILVVAGEALSRGHVVMMSTTTDGRVVKNAIDGDMPIGVVYADAASGAAVKVVTSGIAYVLPDAAITAARGNVLYSSSTAAGLAQQSSSVPATATHFKEIGHWLDTGSGNGILTRAAIHFN